jgi:hypothetical protein
LPPFTPGALDEQREKGEGEGGTEGNNLEEKTRKITRTGRWKRKSRCKKEIRVNWKKAEEKMKKDGSSGMKH